jgi:two-component system OmpR family sensor kinase
VPHIFERFTRGDEARTRTEGSTGLGLSIVDAVVGSHGGSVSVASRPGLTVFTIRLPKNPASDGAPTDDAEEQTSSADQRSTPDRGASTPAVTTDTSDTTGITT